MDAADWVTSVIAAVAAVTGVAALVVAWLSYNRSKDSIKQAERSADQAEISAKHAGESAREAKRLTDLEADRRRQEKAELHRSLRPVVQPDIEADLRESESGAAGEQLLYGTLTVPDRHYRVKAYAKQGPSLTGLALDPVTVPGRPMEFVIERWHPDRKKPLTEEIFFHFWQPEASDQVPVWECICDYEAPREMTGDAGHWVCQVKVNYHDVSDSVW